MPLSMLLAAIVAATPAAAPDRWSCTAVVNGTQQSQVEVASWLRPDGSMRARRITWAPIRVRQTVSAAGLDPLSLWITYRDRPAEDRLEPPTEVTVSVSTGPGPAASGPLKVTFVLDGRQTWTGIQQVEPHRSRRGELISSSTPIEIAFDGEFGQPKNLELLSALQGEHTVDVTLSGRAGRTYATASWRLAASNRQCLTSAARAAAERMVRDPEHADCRPVGDISRLVSAVPAWPTLAC
jgi:hypothetical protein